MIIGIIGIKNPEENNNVILPGNFLDCLTELIITAILITIHKATMLGLNMKTAPQQNPHNIILMSVYLLNRR